MNIRSAYLLFSKIQVTSSALLSGVQFAPYEYVYRLFDE
jgi:hypothetical protein